MSPNEVLEEFLAKNEQKRGDFGLKSENCDIFAPRLKGPHPSC